MSRFVRLAAKVPPLAAATLALILPAGCSDEVSVDREQLERLVAERLEELGREVPDDVSCPDGLSGVPDSRLRCTMTTGEEQYGVTVRVTGVTDGNPDIDVDVDRRPTR